MQLARHIDFCMGSVEAVESRIAVMEEKVVDTEKELCETKARAFEVEEEFRG